MHLLPARSHLRVVLGVLVAFFVVALVTGCGGDDDGDDTGQSQGTAAATGPAKSIVAQIPAWSNPRTAQAADTYVGAATPGGDPYIAVVHQEGQVVVYLCDGKKFWDWFGGKADGGHFDLKSEKGSRVSGEIAAGKLQGTLTLPDGKQLSYSARPATSSSGAEGLFVGTAPTVGYTRRWIALQGEGVRGVDSGGGRVIGAVAVTEPTTTAAGCKNIIPGGCATSCEFLQSMLDFAAGVLIKATTPAAKDRAYNSMHKISQQFVQNKCPLPDDLPTQP